MIISLFLLLILTLALMILILILLMTILCPFKPCTAPLLLPWRSYFVFCWGLAIRGLRFPHWGKPRSIQTWGFSPLGEGRCSRPTLPSYCPY